MHHVLESFAYALDYLNDQVSDVAEADMVRQPAGVRNHPAWTIGHLAASCQGIGGEIGLEPWLPDSWGRSYGTGSVPAGVPGVYPPREELLAVLRDAALRVTTRVQAMSAEEFARPLPDERFRALLPTVGHALTQILVGHTTYHVGQLSVWRRLADLPPVERPFL